MGLQKVQVVDGGFATQLVKHVGESVDGDPLWSARFNYTQPKAILDTHFDFLQGLPQIPPLSCKLQITAVISAGADIIITNTYQASVEGFTQHLDLDEDQSLELIKSTVQLAHLARNQYMSEKVNLETVPLIAGSIGPYGAHLHDGSEYTGSYADYISKETLKKWHRVRMEAVVEAGVDLLAIETIPATLEMEALIELLEEEYPEMKYWLSFQCHNEKEVAHGENFAEACLYLWHNKIINKKNILALGVNCVHPGNVTPLFNSLNGNRGDEMLPLVVYPNSGEIYEVKTGWSGTEDCVPLENYVEEWVALGAKFIGGCCRTNARDIERIKAKVDSL